MGVFGDDLVQDRLFDQFRVTKRHRDRRPQLVRGVQQEQPLLIQQPKVLPRDALQLFQRRQPLFKRRLPPHEVALFDVTPRQLDRIAGDHLPSSYRRKLQNYRYGPGVFKMDFALDGPIPWEAQECTKAATVHVGGTLEEIADSERIVGRRQHPERPFVLVAQSSLFDPTRAPQGKHTAWAYCHVPNGSTIDMSERIIAQIERFAPGFRDRILAQTARTSLDMERYNPNYIGGDINGGVQDWRQLFTRPVARINPYTTPAKDIYLCSSSTPPGGGVHGLCGYHAVRAVLNGNLFN